MRAFLFALALLALPISGIARAAMPAPVNLVTEATVKGAITDYLMQKAAPLNAQVTVKKINYQGDLKLPAGKVTFDVVAPERWEGYGPASVALMVRVDDQVKRNQTVLVEVEALADMVVAARTMERGEVLAFSDLAVAKRDLAQVQGRYFNNIDEAVGLRVKSTMRANAPVRKDNLEKVPVVKSGQVVTIVAENDVVRITATGRAKGPGAPGDLITVQNLSSQKEIAARVVDATTVKVDF
ncbi:MAG: flagellar basal body P-ring formation protein FlgA [Geobacter sp.]|nr:MAG: flagellar basal body P-ring formation protein FlgA [Geobacter sp.]